VLIFPMRLGAFQQPNPDRKDVPMTIQRVSQQILLSGFGGRKAPSRMGKMSTAGVLRLRATSTVSRDNL
jgi:hypothetical protein